MNNRVIRDVPLRIGVRIEIVSIAWMIVEGVGTLVAGVMANSTSLEVFGIDSVIEIIGGVTLLWRLVVETRGNPISKVQRAETVSEWIIGIALVVLAVYIVVVSVLGLVHLERARPSVLGIVITGASSVFMPIIATKKKKVGREIGSKALEADGFCSMVCAYMSWIVLVGVLATAAIGWWWIDSVISLCLVYFVAKEGLEALESAREQSGRRENEA